MKYKTGAFRPNIRKCSLWTVTAHSKYTLNAGNTNVVHHIRFIVIPYFSSITAVTEVQITACVAQHWVDTDTNEANLMRVIDCYTCLHQAR
jgi:hypothetical protein